jgi:aminoglycoside phosphotransferase family enzyme/predicted kinase
MTVEDLQQHQTLAEALADPANWPGAPRDLRLFQTHISSVVLVDQDAYKLKKPLDLGFLDYSTLAKRRHFCDEEIRLNGRLAPDIYLDVVPITGSPEHPVIGGEGEPIEWAVHMRRFDPTAVLGECPERLTPELIDELARRIADFHQAAAIAPPAFGSLDEVAEPMHDNIRQIHARRGAERAKLEQLQAWLEGRLGELAVLIEQRRAEGRVRECHGDLHLGNIVLIDDAPVIFDGIEFNPSLRYIDVYADLAFLTMDLKRLGRHDLARRLLDGYLRITGDYGGLPLLHLYEVYRAMVRAKVAAIHAAERNLSADERELIVAELRRYLRVAAGLSRPPQPGVVITHGVSGSGKSFVTDQVLAALPAVRVRSDVERKRLAGLAAEASSGSGLGADLYSAAMTERTYGRLVELAEGIITAGFIAVIDATCLKAAQRRPFAELAERLGVPFVILDCEAPRAVLEQRVRQRQAAGEGVSEADLAVLASQLSHREPLQAEEQAHCLVIDPEHPLDTERLDNLLLG